MSVLLETYAKRVGEPAHARHVCPVCTEAIEVDGAVFSLGADRRRSVVISVAGEWGQWLADVQFTLGQGPKVDALGVGVPVMIEDLSAAEIMQRWPLFAPAAASLSIRSVCALPVVAEEINAGVLQLYRTVPGLPRQSELADALALADLGLDLVLAAAQDSIDEPEWISDHDLGDRGIVYQATGAVAAQLDIRPDDALARLKFYSYSHDLAISDVARAVMAGQLHLDPDPGP